MCVYIYIYMYMYVNIIIYVYTYNHILRVKRQRVRDVGHLDGWRVPGLHVIPAPIHILFSYPIHEP